MANKIFPASLLAIAVALASSPAVAQEAHACGGGLRAVTMREQIACPCSGPAPELLADGSYLVSQLCPASVCYATTVEWWSDWPECPGAVRHQGLPTGYWGRSLTGDDLPLAFPPDPEPQPEETP